MTKALSLTSRHGGVFQLCLLLLLATSVLLPRGFMPVRDARGVIYITLCAGTGPVAASVLIPFDDDGQTPGDHEDGKPAKACSFAGNASPLAVVENAPLPDPLPWFDLPRDGVVETAAAPGRGMAAPPPPSQAPPIALS